MLKKLVITLLLAALFVTIILYAPPYLVGAIVIVSCLMGLFEYARLFFENKFERIVLVCVGVGVVVPFIVFSSLGLAILILLFAVMFLSLMFMMKSTVGSFDRLAIAVFGVIYLSVSLPSWYYLFNVEQGRYFVLLTMSSIILCDTMGMIAGKVLGKHPVTPKISPNKTLEGYIGCFVGAMIGVYLIGLLFLQDTAMVHLFVLGLIIGVSATVGDLVESFMKRSRGVKDSGSLLPEHGGILDRLDSSVFTAPAVLLYLKLVAGVF